MLIEAGPVSHEMSLCIVHLCLLGKSEENTSFFNDSLVFNVSHQLLITADGNSGETVRFRNLW